jgi:hypothetical protein
MAERGSYVKDWDYASAAQRLAIATAWFDAYATPAEKAEISPSDVAAQVAFEHNEAVSSGLGGSLASYLSNGADAAVSTKGYNELTASPNGGGLVGSSMTTVKQLLGAPSNEQVISGQALWYYREGSKTYQVVFQGDVVASVNLYG